MDLFKSFRTPLFVWVGGIPGSISSASCVRPHRYPVSTFSTMMTNLNFFTPIRVLLCLQRAKIDQRVSHGIQANGVVSNHHVHILQVVIQVLLPAEGNKNLSPFSCCNKNECQRNWLCQTRVNYLNLERVKHYRDF